MYMLCIIYIIIAMVYYMYSHTVVSDMLLVKELSKSTHLVLIMNSLARWGAGCGSRGRITMLLSSGYP